MKKLAMIAVVLVLVLPAWASQPDEGLRVIVTSVDLGTRTDNVFHHFNDDVPASEGLRALGRQADIVSVRILLDDAASVCSDARSCANAMEAACGATEEGSTVAELRFSRDTETCGAKCTSGHTVRSVCT